jgi:translocation and assembly module TamB
VLFRSGQAGTLHAEDLMLRREQVVWRPHADAWLGLSLAELSAQRVRYSSGPPSTTPAAAPTDLRLPLSLQLAQLRIGTLTIDDLPPLHQVQARVSLGERAGTQHRIDRLSLTVDQARVEGQLQIGALAPLDTRASLTARRASAAEMASAGTPVTTPSGGPAWQAEAQASGPLARLAVTLRLQGGATPSGAAAPRLDARATVAPFAPWPLAALQFETRALDLAALSPRLPRTLLDGQASVDSDGLDRPARIQLQLNNQQPAAWRADSAAGTARAPAPAGLPLRSLSATASATPRQPDRLDLTQFTLQLADAQGAAGRVSGSGHWQGQQASLALQLDMVQPSRLDRRAPPLSLSGPLALTLAPLHALPAPAAPSAPSAPRAPHAPQASSAPGGADTATTQPAGPTVGFDARLSGQRLDGADRKSVV